MKKGIFVAIIGLAFMSAACHKPITTPEDGARIAISGSWELRQSTGGIAGTIDYPTGNGNLLTFKTDGTYIISGANFSQQGQYHLQSANSGNWWLARQYNVNNQPISQKDSIRIEASKLVFIPTNSCCDMPTISYEKLH